MLSAAFLMNCLALSLQIAGTVRTQSKSSIVTASVISFVAILRTSFFKNSIDKENTFRADNSLPIASFSLTL